MSTVIIRQAKQATGQNDNSLVDILVSFGVIVTVAPAGTIEKAEGTTEIDVNGALVLPGLFDLHAHLCEPGHESRERISTASQAAIQGGVTGIQAMPDTAPALDSSANIELFKEICAKESPLEIIPAGCITKGMAGEEQVSYNSLRGHGVRFITDGDKRPENLLLLHRAMQYAGPLGMIFAIRGDVPSLTVNSTMHPSKTAYVLGLAGSPPCAEEIGTDTVIRLSYDTRNALHVQTVSTGEAADIIRQGKTRHPHLSAEVALHHLLFTHEDVGDYNTTFKTIPPLRDKEDNLALIEAVNDGTIDCIVSGHCPVTDFEKKQDFCISPPGMNALDTFLPALYTHLVKPGLMSWDVIVKSCSDNPRRLLDLAPAKIAENEPANFVIFDTEDETVVTREFLKSKSSNNPFIGKTLEGKVKHVFLGNQHFNM